MKTKILLVTITLIVSLAASADPRAPRVDRSERLAKKLNLTEDQQELFQQTMRNHREEIKTARESIQAETKAELATFLDAEQMQKLEERKETRQSIRKHRKQHKNRRIKRN